MAVTSRRRGGQSTDELALTLPVLLLLVLGIVDFARVLLAATLLTHGRGGARGQALVIVALGMVAFFGFLGLALDGASAYLAQQNLQKDADLAAISGTWAYYHNAYQESDTYGAVVSGMAAANQVVDT